MIAADTSSFIAYLQGEKGNDVEKIEQALTFHALVLPPVVLSELLSDFNLTNEVIEVISNLPILPIKDDYWKRAGLLRSKLIADKLKARLADTLIAQICVDHNVPLITRDQDFRHFSRYCGLCLV